MMFYCDELLFGILPHNPFLNIETINIIFCDDDYDDYDAYDDYHSDQDGVNDYYANYYGNV